MTTQRADLRGLVAEWTPDCCGKQDYDASLLRLSTRYYPRGGGFLMVSGGGAVVEGNEARPHIRPSASAGIYWNHDEDLDAPLAEAKFEGDTEAEVKAQVEAWAAQQYANIVRALSAPGEPGRGEAEEAAKLLDHDAGNLEDCIKASRECAEEGETDDDLYIDENGCISVTDATKTVAAYRLAALALRSQAQSGEVVAWDSITQSELNAGMNPLGPATESKENKS